MCWKRGVPVDLGPSATDFWWETQLQTVGSFSYGLELQILFFLANLPDFSLVHLSDFAHFKQSFCVTEESTQLTARWEREKEANCVFQGGTQIGVLQGPRLAGGWWSLGCMQKEWLILEMLWLDHEFGLGKHCLQFTSRNEAEFTFRCHKTLMFAKCLSNPSTAPPTELKCYDLSHSESSRGKKVGPLHLLAAV